jgi:hypothetical protein
MKEFSKTKPRDSYLNAKSVKYRFYSREVYIKSHQVLVGVPTGAI